jgi:hypothetical protein
MLMNWLRKHRYSIFLITVVGFLVGSFMGFGSYFFTTSPYDAVIVVNGHKISYKRYQSRYRQYLNQRRDQDKEALNEKKIAQIRQETLQDLVRETVFLTEADKYGIVVTDNELAAYIQSAPAFQRDGKFDQSAYVQVVSQVLRMPMDEFEEDRRREIRIQKLQALMSSAVKVGDPEFRWFWDRALASADAAARKSLQENPGELREQVRREQVANAFQEWLGQVNNQLKVKVYLEKFEGTSGETPS